jgi:GAF domain-containing protein
VTVNFAPLVDQLRKRLRASRVTLRLDVKEANFPVVAESLAPGIHSIRDDESLDQRNLATVRNLFRTKSLLVQEHCARADVPVSEELMLRYAVKAQMLAPILDANGEIRGWLSAHYCPGPRKWHKSDRAAITEAAVAVCRALDRGAAARGLPGSRRSALVSSSAAAGAHLGAHLRTLASLPVFSVHGPLQLPG